MKVDRLVSIIMILLQQKRVSAKDLATHFEVSVRTIYRDIDAINLAGIPVYATPGLGGGFEIMENYKIDKNVFSSDDLSAIVMGLTSISNTINNHQLMNALAKVKSFIPSEYINDIEVKANQIHIDLNPWFQNRNIQPYLEIIKEAIQDHKLLQFDYINHSGEKTTRTVEPYQLILKNSHWYYQGYCLKRNDFRFFKLSRITSLTMTEQTFTPREYQKPQLDIEELVSFKQITIKLRIHYSILDRVLDYCPYENFSPDGKEHYIVHFPFIENEYFYDVLLSLGNKCECLEPPHVRENVKKLADSIVRLHS